jgi:hypothetical protein
VAEKDSRRDDRRSIIHTPRGMRTAEVMGEEKKEE